MPTYVYGCADHHPTEILARMGEAPAAVACAVCGRPAARTYLPVHTKRPSLTIDSSDGLTRFQHEHLG